jgi:pimeloyl-ACP methyl ester carboxylesterase
MAKMQSSYRITASDLYGYGSSPSWGEIQGFTLNDDVDLLAPVLDSMAGPIHLVGHSYGAAVSLKVAQRYTQKISSLTVYEPVAFTALFASADTQAVAHAIIRLKNEILQDYQQGRADSAARKFIDYWSGPGTWYKFGAQQQAAMSARIAAVIENFEAIFAERNTMSWLADLDIPTLCLYGEKSPHSTIAISRLLGETLPNVTLRAMPGMGHMGPVTHSEAINDQIEGFIKSHTSPMESQEAQFAA